MGFNFFTQQSLNKINFNEQVYLIIIIIINNNNYIIIIIIIIDCLEWPCPVHTYIFVRAPFMAILPVFTLFRLVFLRGVIISLSFASRLPDVCSLTHFWSVIRGRFTNNFCRRFVYIKASHTHTGVSCYRSVNHFMFVRISFSFLSL